jgi:hypothetical protein
MPHRSPAVTCVLASLMLGLTLPAQAADKAQLDAVSVHLFLANSGTLSTDVTNVRNFHAWNFVPSGDGIPDGEQFDAVLVKVRLTAAKEIFAKGEQARLTVVASESKKVLRREKLADVYVGPERIVHYGFYLARIGCTPLDIVVTARPTVIRKTLRFNCGE